MRALCRIKSAQNPEYAPVTKHASENRPSACPLLDFFKSPFPSFNDCQTDLNLLSTCSEGSDHLHYHIYVCLNIFMGSALVIQPLDKEDM